MTNDETQANPQRQPPRHRHRINRRVSGKGPPLGLSHIDGISQRPRDC
jgi:hypothetical protein